MNFIVMNFKRFNNNSQHINTHQPWHYNKRITAPNNHLVCCHLAHRYNADQKQHRINQSQQSGDVSQANAGDMSKAV